MFLLWIIGLMPGNITVPSDLMNMAADSINHADRLLLVICALTTVAMLYFIYHSRLNGWKLVRILFLVLWGIQFFMRQIEPLWFNEI